MFEYFKHLRCVSDRDAIMNLFDFQIFSEYTMHYIDINVFPNLNMLHNTQVILLLLQAYGV